MTNKKILLIRRILRYEFDYLLRKFQIFEILVFILSILGILVTGLGDTQSFFIGENSPIPETWKILKQPNIVLFLSILILVIPSVLRKKKDNNELLITVKENVIPYVDLKLDNLQENIKQNFNFEVRISLWIPVRLGFFDWNLQMVCKTQNIPQRELEASFKLDEGVIGYTYLKNRRKYWLEFIDVSNPSNLPSSYIPLRGENNILINPDIKIVLAVASFQEGSILGLLAIDTDNINDLSKMQDNKLHGLAVEWIRECSGVVRLLWRMKNNI